MHRLRYTDPYEEGRVDGTPTGRWMTNSEGDLEIEIEYMAWYKQHFPYTPNFFGRLLGRKPRDGWIETKPKTMWCHWKNLSIIQEPIINECTCKAIKEGAL